MVILLTRLIKDACCHCNRIWAHRGADRGWPLVAINSVNLTLNLNMTFSTVAANR
jgi:hypothetical protein